VFPMDDKAAGACVDARRVSLLTRETCQCVDSMLTLATSTSSDESKRRSRLDASTRRLVCMCTRSRYDDIGLHQLIADLVHC
jgi:hypothetical protein